jgi:hypothetical protein
VRIIYDSITFFCIVFQSFTFEARLWLAAAPGANLYGAHQRQCTEEKYGPINLGFHTQQHNTTTKQKMGNFSYHSPLIWKITNPFKHTNLNIALHATNTIHQQLTNKILKTSTNSSGICKFKCGTCNNSYVGQSSRSIATRHKEHTQYIRTNNPISACALHILNNRHEYGTADETLELLISCNKGTKMNCWELFYMQAFHQWDILIEDHKVSDINPLYELAQHLT